MTRNRTKGSKNLILPEVHTFHAREVCVLGICRINSAYRAKTKTTLEEVQSVSDFVEHLEDLETPSQLAAGLQDPLLQKLLILDCSDDASRRLDFWLLRYFEEELEILREGFGLSPTLPEILSGLAKYIEVSKVGLEVRIILHTANTCSLCSLLWSSS